MSRPELFLGTHLRLSVVNDNPELAWIVGGTDGESADGADQSVEVQLAAGGGPVSGSDIAETNTTKKKENNQISNNNFQEGRIRAFHTYFGSV